MFGPLNLTEVRAGPGWVLVREEVRTVVGAVAIDVYALHESGARVPPGPNLFGHRSAAAREVERLLRVWEEG